MLVSWFRLQSCKFLKLLYHRHQHFSKVALKYFSIYKEKVLALMILLWYIDSDIARKIIKIGWCYLCFGSGRSDFTEEKTKEDIYYVSRIYETIA